MIKHKIGDRIYIPSSFYLSHGSDDVHGGLATIEDFEISKDLPKDHINSIMVSFKEVPGHSYNYLVLLQEQDELKKQFKDCEAFPDPDIDTPWIENGDIVNGKEWTGGDIW